MQFIERPFKCYVMQWGVSDFLENSITQMYDSMLLALRGGEGQDSRKKHYVTLEWPLSSIMLHMIFHPNGTL